MVSRLVGSHVSINIPSGLIVAGIGMAGMLTIMAASTQLQRHFSSRMPMLPSGVEKYSQVPKNGLFVKETIPKGLLRQHNTKQGTWGLIKVEKGSLQYQINEPRIITFKIDAPGHAIIEPTVYHEVKPLTDDVEFAVEFYRFPGTGPVEEKRE